MLFHHCNSPRDHFLHNLRDHSQLIYRLVASINRAWQAGISADSALRLSRALGLSDMFWINMQAHYDAEIARENIGTELATIERIA